LDTDVLTIGGGPTSFAGCTVKKNNDAAVACHSSSKQEKDTLKINLPDTYAVAVNDIIEFVVTTATSSTYYKSGQTTGRHLVSLRTTSSTDNSLINDRIGSKALWVFNENFAAGTEISTLTKNPASVTTLMVKFKLTTAITYAAATPNFIEIELQTDSYDETNADTMWPDLLYEDRTGANPVVVEIKDHDQIPASLTDASFVEAGT
jgi:hypothetical protein